MPSTKGKGKAILPTAAFTIALFSTQSASATAVSATSVPAAASSTSQQNEVKTALNRVLSNSIDFAALGAAKQGEIEALLREDMHVSWPELSTPQLIHGDGQLFSEDSMSHSAPYTNYLHNQAIFNACNSVFYWNEDVFGIQWTETMFKLDAKNKDTKVRVAGDDTGNAESLESDEIISNEPVKESDEGSDENCSEGPES
ncbi:hypothetical protein PG996_006165 [Apiospora saccharicola]|uniref:SCP domain-containing protein n=1 Tax=Apiospora saccharicola TaxID=335842 RepID=A0ABR1VPM2_9PEZI